MISECVLQPAVTEQGSSDLSMRAPARRRRAGGRGAACLPNPYQILESSTAPYTAAQSNPPAAPPYTSPSSEDTRYADTGHTSDNSALQDKSPQDNAHADTVDTPPSASGTSNNPRSQAAASESTTSTRNYSDRALADTHSSRCSYSCRAPQDMAEWMT